MTGNSEKLTGSHAEPVMIREESDDENAPMATDQIPAADGPVGDEDKKKLGFMTTYDGFSIWGWVLCLLVTRKGGPSKKKTDSTAAQALMEEWIVLTQEQQEEEG
jgi:hypothetical protein